MDQKKDCSGWGGGGLWIIKKGLQATCCGANRAVSQDSRLKRCVSVAASAPTSLPDCTAVGTRVPVTIKARVFVETWHSRGLVCPKRRRTDLEAVFPIPGVRERAINTNVLV